MKSATVQPIDRLIEQGDRSIRFSIRTEIPRPYFVPAAMASAQDLAHCSMELRNQFILCRNVLPPGRSLTSLRDCYILPNAAVVTSDGNVLRESCFPYTGSWVSKFFGPWIEGDGVTYTVRLNDPEIIECPTVYIREHGEMGFFHWMHSVLPRVDVFRSHHLSNEHAVLCQSQASYQCDGLALAGMSNVKLITPNSQRPQFFRELLFPSPLVEDGDFWLRTLSVATFYDSLPAPFTNTLRRVYITRRDAEVRRLRNDVEVTQRLESLGFVSLELSAFTFPQQISLLRNCEFVVGVHGAGLSHLINVPTGGGALEILHPRRFWSTYRAIAARRGLRYGFVLGNDENIQGDTFDFDADIEKMISVLRDMGVD
jgi:capsular polysaccharide biosynthesis protein